MIKIDLLSRFDVTMHSGLCEHCVQSLGLTASGLDLLLRMRPPALWQQNPPEPILIPLNKPYPPKFLRRPELSRHGSKSAALSP